MKYFFPLTIHRFNQELQRERTEWYRKSRKQIEIFGAIEKGLQNISKMISLLESKVDSFSSLKKDLNELANKQTASKNELEGVRKVCEESIKQINILQESIRKISDSEKSLERKIDNTEQVVLEKDVVYYYCPHEVKCIEKGGFYTIMQEPFYLEKYQALVKDLDLESVETINQVLSRHMIVRGKADTKLDIFSKSEQEIIADQRKAFYASTVQITNEIYACGKWLLATPKSGMGFTETTIFLDQAGFRKLEHPERIRDKCILDLGAFIGDSSLVLSTYTNRGVFAFEPSRENYAALEKTISLNQNCRITPIKAAIGEKSGEVSFPVRFGMGLSLNSESQELKKQIEMEKVPLISVDEYVLHNNLQVGLIKVDIEGYEQNFLKGAERTLRAQRPALLLSMYHCASDFFNLKILLEEMNLGYRFKVHKEVNEHIHYDTMLIAEVE